MIVHDRMERYLTMFAEVYQKSCAKISHSVKITSFSDMHVGSQHSWFVLVKSPVIYWRGFDSASLEDSSLSESSFANTVKPFWNVNISAWAEILCSLLCYGPLKHIAAGHSDESIALSNISQSNRAPFSLCDDCLALCRRLCSNRAQKNRHTQEFDHKDPCLKRSVKIRQVQYIIYWIKWWKAIKVAREWQWFETMVMWKRWKMERWGQTVHWGWRDGKRAMRERGRERYGETQMWR